MTNDEPKVDDLTSGLKVLEVSKVKVGNLQDLKFDTRNSTLDTI